MLVVVLEVVEFELHFTVAANPVAPPMTVRSLLKFCWLAKHPSLTPRQSSLPAAVARG